MTLHSPSEAHAGDRAKTLRETEGVSDVQPYAGDLSHFLHPLATSDEVVETPRRFHLLERPIVAYRDREGVVAFDDLCIHRGTALSLGEITDEGYLRCAYHGWTYDRTGACVRIPSRPEGSAIPRAARAIAHPATEAYGVVWLSLAEPLAPLPPFAEYNDPAWHGSLLFSQTWKTSAGRIIENFCDWSHFPWVHENLLGTRDKTVIDPVDVWEDSHTMGFTFEQVEPQESLSSPSVSGDTPGERPVRYEVVVHLPFTVHVRKVSGEASVTKLVLSVCPTGPKLSTLHFWVFRNHSFDMDDGALLDFELQVFEQDRRIVESQRPEEIPLSLREELHIRVPDAFSVEYRRVLQKIAEATPFLP